MHFPSIGLSAEDFISIFNYLPMPASIYDHEGTLVALNRAQAEMFQQDPAEWIGRFSILTDPQLVAAGIPAYHARVMQSESFALPPSPFNARATGYQDDAAITIWLRAFYSPLYNEQGNITHLIAILQNVSNEVSQAQQIEQARDEIASQQAMIESLSTPVVQVWEGILAMPLVGTIDSRRAAQITEELLVAITTYRAECVIIDITGVPLVDTQVGQYLIQSAQASKLLGCQVALVGIGVEMAQTLVQLGIDLSTITTRSNLQSGIAWAFAKLGLQVVRRG
ncbi:MAG: hypothetical protein Fur005_38320 [Roseiflexaceae bacterium]